MRKILVDCAGNRLRTRRMLIDRGFFSVAVIMLKKARGKFLTPAVKTSRIKQVIEGYARGKRRAFSTYAMKSKDGKTVTFNLAIIKKKKGGAGWD